MISYPRSIIYDTIVYDSILYVDHTRFCFCFPPLCNSVTLLDYLTIFLLLLLLLLLLSLSLSLSILAIAALLPLVTTICATPYGRCLLCAAFYGCRLHVRRHFNAPSVLLVCLPSVIPTTRKEESILLKISIRS
jgi:hypothetical protein